MTAPSHRPLPDDPAIDVLDADVRSRVAASWRSRARNELSTSTAFASVTRSLVGIGAPHAIVRRAAEAVADEVRHAEICAHVARAYEPHGPAVEPSPVIDEVPIGGRREHDLAAVLYVVMQSSINEGVATAYLQRCMDEATFALARAAVRDIFEDEVHHARFGWTLLASGAMRDAWRPAVAEALPALLDRVATVWLPAVKQADPPPGHGAIRAADMPDVVRGAYEGIVLPGMDAVGIDSRAARAWCAAWRSAGD